jgi:RimJ/RimL family protein N-acetyltransferase
MFARTERLLLRPGWIEDAPALASAIGDEAVARNLARVPHPYTEADAASFLALPEQAGLPRLLMFARTQGSPRLIGGIGLHVGATGAPELGYWIARPFWGLGYATEAGRAIVALAHDSLRLPRITASHMRDNPASGHVLCKLGFRPTGGTTMLHSLGRGVEVPCLLYARHASDSVPDVAICDMAA